MPCVVVCGLLGSVGVGSVELVVKVELSGLVAVAVAVLSTLPASISSWVKLWVPVKVVVSMAVGAREVMGPPEIAALVSEIVMLVSVVLPVLVITKVYRTLSPTSTLELPLVSW
jgi:hypothetical protein